MLAIAALAFATSLLPAPRTIADQPCHGDARIASGLSVDASFDAGAREILDERLLALGLAPTTRSTKPTIRVRVEAHGDREAYTLAIGEQGSIEIGAADADGAFDAAMTLAQLVRPHAGAVRLPCVRIRDSPALRWRIVSDDVSRGPLPTMRYFKERIRGLASLKINGYSPYLEQVVFDARYPYVAPPDPITAAQLRELRDYAHRFHVTLIPEQQTLAHMHESLKWESIAASAELAHGYLFSPSDPATYAYVLPLVRSVLTAVAPTPFMHIGADEPLDLGRGKTAAALAADGNAAVFAGHVRRVADLVHALHARPMIWDDAIQRDPSIVPLLPRDTVVVDFHYGVEPSFAGYIKRVAAGGLEQMVSPGATNWNELYPDLESAYANIGRFVSDGRDAHVLGMFMTVWHDDGETLYESTWAPLGYAAASAWETTAPDVATFHVRFARAFFASDDTRFAHALDELQAIRALLHTKPEGDPSNYLFWADPFDARIGERIGARVPLGEVRLRAERVLALLAGSEPPAHAAAARAMQLGAARYDAMARRFQIGAEARATYADARAHVGGASDAIVYRDLNLAKYACWELRDAMLSLEPLHAAAWRYESRPAALPRVLERYHLAAQRAIDAADRLNAIQREDYLRAKTLPSFEQALGRAP